MVLEAVASYRVRTPLDEMAADVVQPLTHLLLSIFELFNIF